MTQYFELTTLKTVIFGAGKAASAIEKWISEGNGQLHGAWFSDIGSLNEVYILRSFAGIEDMMAERDRMHRSANPFGCLDLLLGIDAESYKGLDFMGDVPSGEMGPVYEIRTYGMKLNGLMPTMEKWEAALPARNAYSPCIAAMYGLDGSPRLTQIWPYKSLEERGKARAQSVTDGNWPPKGGPDWLTPDMTSTIAMPLPFSPLQ